MSPLEIVPIYVRHYFTENSDSKRKTTTTQGFLFISVHTYVQINHRAEGKELIILNKTQALYGAYPNKVCLRGHLLRKPVSIHM